LEHGVHVYFATTTRLLCDAGVNVANVKALFFAELSSD